MMHGCKSKPKLKVGFQSVIWFGHQVVCEDRRTIANYHYGGVAKSIACISLGISVGLRVDFPNDFRGLVMCVAGQWHSGDVLICV